jgi:hypothetical protein
MLRYAEEVILYKAKVLKQIKDSLRIVTLEKIASQYNLNPEDFNFDAIKGRIMIKNGHLTKSDRTDNPSQSQTLLVQFGPFLPTHWDQSAPYNSNLGGSCQNLFGETTNYNVAACVVAVAQLLAFYEPNVNVNNTNINWSYLKQNPEIVEPNYFNAGDPIDKRNMIASLIKFCSDGCDISYTCSGNSYYMNNVRNFLTSYGISMNNEQSFNFNTVKTNLQNINMTFCQGRTGSNQGHSWLIDGYMSLSPNGSTSNYNDYVHANMGMGSYYNGYYLVNSNTGLTFNAGFAHFNTNIKMYTNVRR